MDEGGPSFSRFFRTINVLSILSKLLQVWTVRCAVIISLIFQILLTFLAPRRKRSSRYLTNISIWSAYLLADWTAIYAINSILSNKNNRYSTSLKIHDHTAALWGPLVLLHLGGPDSITAFSLEDNELWIRHLIRLVVQLVAVAYIYYLTLPAGLWAVTVWLVFVAAAIKYAERTRSLYLASLGMRKDSMRAEPDPGPNYAHFMEEYSSMREARLPSRIDIQHEGDSERGHGAEEGWDSVREVQEGYRFYRIFRGLITGHTCCVERPHNNIHMFTTHEKIESKEFFLRLEPEVAFRVMEVELNFIYDELFTKMATLYRNRYGFLMRLICSVLPVVALLLFIVTAAPEIRSRYGDPNSRFSPHDFPSTCILFLGAVILDLLALVKILFSDWTLAKKGRHGLLTNKFHVIHRMVSSQHRWSESISQYNLIDYSLNKPYQWMEPVIDYFGLKSTVNELWHKGSCPVNDCMLKEFIFNELKERAKKAKGPASELCHSRGKAAFSNHNYPQKVKDSVEAAEYDESLLLWHIATDLLYYTLEDLPNRDERENTEPNHRQISKILSDYMAYLIELKPTMMSAVDGISQIRFQDTHAEAMRFFQGHKSVVEHGEACEKLLSVNTTVKPSEVKGDRSKSLLFDACILAKDLKTFHQDAEDPKTNHQDEMWLMISKVWLDLLCYGASHCTGNAHAQQLSKGGELITFVWLLMAHFGLDGHFKIEAGHARAKLILDWEQHQTEGQ